jgi:hypothetical protein
MSGMGIEMARQSIKEARDKAKEHQAAKKKAMLVLARLIEKMNKLEDELKKQGVNIKEAAIKYIQAEARNAHGQDAGVPPEIQATFVDFQKTKKLVNLREDILRVKNNIDRLDNDLITQMEAAKTLMTRYPALRGGRKRRRKKKTKRKRKTKKRRKRKRRKTKRRKRN